MAVDVENLFNTYFLSSNNLRLNFNISKKFKITKISCGGTHSLALTGSGDVLAWGYGTSGQLGQGDKIYSLPDPTLVNFRTDAKMSQVYSGRNHSMAITSITHTVYTWGAGTQGQLGYKKKYAHEPQIVEFLDGKDIVKGSLGQDNSACIDRKGNVYAWGGNSNNKLGIGSKSSCEIFPQLSKYLSNLKIACRV